MIKLVMPFNVQLKDCHLHFHCPLSSVYSFFLFLFSINSSFWHLIQVSVCVFKLKEVVLFLLIFTQRLEQALHRDKHLVPMQQKILRPYKNGTVSKITWLSQLILALKHKFPPLRWATVFFLNYSQGWIHF